MGWWLGTLERWLNRPETNMFLPLRVNKYNGDITPIDTIPYRPVARINSGWPTIRELSRGGSNRNAEKSNKND
jgi:hypothetical protein